VGAVTVCALTLLGAAGWLPVHTLHSATGPSTHASGVAGTSGGTSHDAMLGVGASRMARDQPPRPSRDAADDASDDATATTAGTTTGTSTSPGVTSTPPSKAGLSTALPAHSGTGRRIVFDQTAQRVWLVSSDGTTERTYLVSGSRYPNLSPGIYHVYSKSPTATAFDDAAETMQWFVRFASGQTAAIGFHSIPRFADGQLVEQRTQLGTPLSAGCVRQWIGDAKALWDFAPVGTQVDVVKT
jgi:hypothetical protein